MALYEHEKLKWTTEINLGGKDLHDFETLKNDQVISKQKAISKTGKEPKTMKKEIDFTALKSDVIDKNFTRIQLLEIVNNFMMDNEILVWLSKDKIRIETRLFITKGREK